MKITIETDTEGETQESKTFEHVTQFIVAGSLIREKIAPGAFRYCVVTPGESTNDMIGVLQAAIESLRDLKQKNKQDGYNSTN